MQNSERTLCVQKGYIDNSVITCDKIIETTKSILTKTVPIESIPANFNAKKLIWKMRTFYILVIFLLITMTLSIAVSISFFIKYRARQKHLLPFHNVNVEFKKLDVNNVF